MDVGSGCNSALAARGRSGSTLEINRWRSPAGGTAGGGGGRTYEQVLHTGHRRGGAGSLEMVPRVQHTRGLSGGKGLW